MSKVPCTRSEGLLMSLSSVTDTSNSVLGKQEEMVLGTARLTVCVRFGGAV